MAFENLFFVGIKVKGNWHVLLLLFALWGGDAMVGAWIPPVSFRIRESAENFDENLKLASFSGGTFEVTREDGLKDVIYSGMDASGLVHEPTEAWGYCTIQGRKSVIMPILFMRDWA